MLKLVKIPMVIKKIIFLYNGDDIIVFRYDLKTIKHIGEMIGVSHSSVWYDLNALWV